MNSIILKTASRAVALLMVAFSIFLLIRGHNEPGGGFIGGLTAAAAFVLLVLADGVAAARRALRLRTSTLAATGLAVALAAGLAAAVAGQPFLTGLWIVVGGVPLGTPLLFDLGVYLAVMGGVLTLVFALEEGA